MIVVIDMEIPELSRIPSEDIIRLVEEIIHSSKRRNHLFIISLEIALWIHDNDSLELSQPQRFFIKYLGLKYQELLEVVSNANVTLNVKREGILTLSANGHWFIGYKSLINSNYLDKITIVVENIKFDGEIYDLMLKNIEKTEIGRILTLSYTFHHGGGGSMADVLEYLTKRNNITVCVCDTDYLVPKGSQLSNETTFEKVKNKAAEIKREYHRNALKNKPFFGIVVGTPGRELENFFPPLSIKNILEHKNSKIQKSANSSINYIIEKMYGSNNPIKFEKLYLHFDIKKGIEIEKIIESCSIKETSIHKVEKKFKVIVSDEPFIADEQHKIRNYDICKVDNDELCYNVRIPIHNKNSQIKRKEFHIFKSKFNWFLNKYNLTNCNINELNVNGFGSDINQIILTMSEKKREKLIEETMKTDFWVRNYNSWFSKFYWYLISMNYPPTITSYMESSLERGVKI